MLMIFMNSVLCIWICLKYVDPRKKILYSLIDTENTYLINYSMPRFSIYEKRILSL